MNLLFYNDNTFSTNDSLLEGYVCCSGLENIKDYIKLNIFIDK